MHRTSSFEERGLQVQRVAVCRTCWYMCCILGAVHFGAGKPPDRLLLLTDGHVFPNCSMPIFFIRKANPLQSSFPTLN